MKIPWRLAGAGAALAAGLSACVQAPLPPARLYRLPLQADGAASVAAPVAGDARHWALRQPVRLPAPLERTQLLLDDGAAALEVLDAHRWAEPLRDGIARVLRHDLAQALPAGSSVAVLPGEVPVSAQTRLSIDIDDLRLQATPPGVALSARWTLLSTADPVPPAPARCAATGEVRLQAPAARAAPEDLVLALRAALAQLAARIAAQAPAGC